MLSYIRMITAIILVLIIILYHYHYLLMKNEMDVSQCISQPMSWIIFVIIF